MAVPTTVHCDHLIRAQTGAADDMQRALSENDEVYEFLHSASRKYGIGFWRPGAGIIHQVVLENYAFPGGLMIGTDSHTPNGGGLGMVAIGVGGADCGDVMAGLPWEVLHPKLIGVHLTGKLAGWTSPKDVIIYLCGLLTVKGGTNKIIEYFGPGAESISATGKGTISNMGAELGATTSLFPFDARMAAYLAATDRADIAALAEQHRAAPRADPEVVGQPAASTTRSWRSTSRRSSPTSSGPHSPDRARPISKLAAEVKANGWPAEIKAALIGSCTNSSYEDMRRAAHVARQALKAGLRAKTPFLVTPGSERIYQTIKRDGDDGDLREDRRHGAGQRVRPLHRPVEALGRRPRGGQHDRLLLQPELPRPQRRQRGHPVVPDSPEIVTALAFAGTLEFDPVNGTLPGPDGKAFRFTPPEAEELPAEGFARGEEGYEAPAADGAAWRWRCSPTASGSSSCSPSRAGTARTSSGCRSWSRRRARPRPTTSRRPGRGSLPRPPRQDQRQHVPRRASTRSPARRARA